MFHSTNEHLGGHLEQLESHLNSGHGFGQVPVESVDLLCGVQLLGPAVDVFVEQSPRGPE